ncbi:cyclophilin-like protein [Lactarius sanguifluus]|nr:cyclophilin-like protein [Lactarius sanguifluus]
MIQTGDPLVDGTGGTSIWDRDFEDEFSNNLKHESAQSVRHTPSGSQSSITTSATPWLDKENTTFGRKGNNFQYRLERSGCLY